MPDSFGRGADADDRGRSGEFGSVPGRAEVEEQEMKEEINIEELVKTVRNTAKQMNFKAFLHATSAQIADLLEELLQYRKIGTVGECQDAMEKIKKLKE